MSQFDTPLLIKSLLSPQAYNHPVDDIRLLETHISWVILTGPYAYKIKKPIQLDFVDFSTLDKRHFYCQEELRLNRRLAPNLYLDVTPITGNPKSPRVAGDGPTIEYAVKLTQFSQKDLLSNAISCGKLHHRHIDNLATEVAEFHQQIDVGQQDSLWGTPSCIIAPVRENFQVILEADLESDSVQTIHQLARWSEQQFASLETEFEYRKKEGFIRECHGDMHLGNMILDHDDVTVFDGIEFNDNFRWIDVMSEVAFCVMDLKDRGRADFSNCFLNAYLQQTGDYRGLMVLQFYAVYRAMVRAKVVWIRIRQEQSSGKVEPELYNQLRTYLDLAQKYMNPQPPCLMITHGVSGSGKTYGTQTVIETLGTIRIRSDIERKRLFPQMKQHDTQNVIGQNRYEPLNTKQTYQHLTQLAEQVLQANYSVIVDATFLNRQHRKQFRDIAKRLGVPFLILSFTASREQQRKRIVQRAKMGEDASEATLGVHNAQLQTQQPLDAEEHRFAIEIDSTIPEANNDLVQRIYDRINE